MLELEYALRAKTDDRSARFWTPCRICDESESSKIAPDTKQWSEVYAQAKENDVAA
jgi:hypothetical protein